MTITASCTARFPGVRESVRDARSWVGVVLSDMRPSLPDEVIADAVLVTSELATNAIRHTASGLPGGRYTVRVETDSAEVRVSVLDEGGDQVPHPRTARATEESGRGLALVSAFAEFAGPTTGPTGCVYSAVLRIGHEAGGSCAA